MLYGAMNSPLRPLLQEIHEFGRMGFDYLELTMDPPQAHHTLIRKTRQDVLDGLARYGMGVVCHLPTFVSTADPTESIREASIQETILSLREASGLAPLKVVLHPSFIRGLGAMMKEQSRQYAMEALDRILKEADGLGFPVCVENLFPQSNSLVEAEDFDALFLRFPSARLTLDTGHAHIGNHERITGFIKKHASRIGHIHASDNSGRDDEHLPIGVGSIDFPKIVKALKEIGYDDTITLEVFSKDRDYLRISREKLSEMFASASGKV